jgi:hypothetical protein
VQVLPATSESNGENVAATISAHKILNGINQTELNSAGAAQNLSSDNIPNEDTKLEINTEDAARNLTAYHIDGNSTATEVILPYGCRLVCIISHCYIRCRW